MCFMHCCEGINVKNSIGVVLFFLLLTVSLGLRSQELVDTSMVLLTVPGKQVASGRRLEVAKDAEHRAAIQVAHQKFELDFSKRFSNPGKASDRSPAILKKLGNLPVAVVRGVNARDLRAMPGVVDVIPDSLSKASATGAALNQIGAALQGGSTSGLTGAGQRVAVIDGPVQTDHPALNGAFDAEACFVAQSGETFSVFDEQSNQFVTYRLDSPCVNQLGPGAASGICVNGDCPTTRRHGTLTNALVAGRTNAMANTQGVAPAARLISIVGCGVSVNVSTGQPVGIRCRLSDYVAALDYAFSYHKYVQPLAAISMSIGGIPNNGCMSEPGYWAVESMISEMLNYNLLVAISSGNEGLAYAGPGFPSCVPSAISVGGVDPLGNLGQSIGSGGKVFKSQFGMIYAPWSPGSAIAQSNVDVISFGSSLSTPMVAGAIALMKQQFPTAIWQDLRDSMMQRYLNGRPVIHLPTMQNYLWWKSVW